MEQKQILPFIQSESGNIFCSPVQNQPRSECVFVCAICERTKLVNNILRVHVPALLGAQNRETLIVHTDNAPVPDTEFQARAYTYVAVRLSVIVSNNTRVHIVYSTMHA